MSKLSEFRAQHPEYGDMSDSALADALHARFYSDMPKADFDREIGVQRPGTVEDMARSFGSGFRQSVAAIPGIPGSIESLGRAGINAAGRYIAGQPGDTVSPETVLPTGADMIQREAENTRFGQPVPYYQPQTTAGRYARAVGEFAPGAALGPARAATALGHAVTRGGLNVAVPALASEAAADVAGYVAPGSENISRVAAALMAPWLAGRVLSPTIGDPRRMGAVQTLEDAGVNLTAGQRTGSNPVMWAESAAADTPFAGRTLNNLTEQQAQQFNRAAMTQMGEANAVAATPDVMQANALRIGAEFDRLMAGRPIALAGGPRRTARGTALNTEMQRLQAVYESDLPASAHAPFVNSLVQDVAAAVRSGSMTPRQYQHWRSELGRRAGNTRVPEYQAFLMGARNALDDMVLNARGPANREAWRTARDQYAHMMILEDALARAGVDAAAGNITPQNLASAARAAGDRGWVRGTGRYAELSRAGQEVMPRLANSGTPARLAVSQPSIGRTVGGAIVGRTVGNPVVQALLGNRFRTRHGIERSTTSAIVDALMGVH